MPNRAGYNPLTQKPYLALIIEDDIIAKNVLLMQLVSFGFKVVEVSTLSGAYDLLKSITPDVIFLDRLLFDQSGMDLLKHRLEDAHLKKIRTIMTTGEKSMDSITEALKLGADDYLIKPIDMKLLKDALIKLGFQMGENLIGKG